LQVSSQKFLANVEFMLDMIPRAAEAYGLSVFRFLLNAQLNQSSYINARKRIENKENVTGFNVEFFFKLQAAYPDLNISCFFEKDQPIRSRHLVKKKEGTTEAKNLDAMEAAVLGQINSVLDSKEREIELLNGQISLLTKNMNLLQEMLDNCKEEKRLSSQKLSQ
jgi:hypothetical protein